MNRLIRILWILCCLPLSTAAAQTIAPDSISTSLPDIKAEVPEVDYERPRQYELAGISFTGIRDQDQALLLGVSGLSIGQIITIPGDEITDAC